MPYIVMIPRLEEIVENAMATEQNDRISYEFASMDEVNDMIAEYIQDDSNLVEADFAIYLRLMQ